MNVHTAGLLSAAIGALLYLNTLQHELVFDDLPAVKYNQDLRPNAHWADLLVHDFWGAALDHPTSHKSYRPLCVATFKLNYLLHKLEPMGYHLVNILLHGVVCYLYVQLVSLVLSEVWPALIAGLLFAVHPIHTEAVAGVVGRAELLCAIFYLLCILSYRRSLKHQGTGWFSMSMVCSLLAMLSKEHGITALGVCLAMDFLVLNKLELLRLLQPTFPSPSTSSTVTTPPAKHHMNPFFKQGTLVGVVGLIAIATRILIANGRPTAMFQDRNINPALFLEWPWRHLSWLHLVFVNIWLCLFPSPLTADWRFGAVPLTQTLTDPHNLYTLLTLLALAALVTFALHQQSGVVLFGMSLLVLPYLPASNLFFPVGFVVAERVLYLPSMGFCLLVAHGVWKLLKWSQTKHLLNLSIKAGLVLLLLTHSAKTLRRNADWSTNLSLYSSGVKLNPHNALLLNNAGLQYLMRGDQEKAISCYRAAMILTPNYTGSYYNYGKLLSMSQQFHQAEEPLRRAIAVAESTGSEFHRLPEAYHLLTQSLLAHPSRLHEAHTLIDHALTHHPHHSQLHVDKCHILEQLNCTQEAIHWCTEALKLHPLSAGLRYHLGVVYLRIGQWREAEQVFREQLLMEPGSVRVQAQLAGLLQLGGTLEELNEALILWQEVLRLDPQNTDALLSLASTQELLSQPLAAVNTLNTLLRQFPYHRQALYQAAELLYRHGNLEEALRVLTRLYHVDKDYLDVEKLLARVQSQLRAQ